MSDFTKKFHFHMFDGAAGGGGAASSAGEGTGETSAAAEPVVVYGKAEAAEDGTSQVGTDTQTEGGAAQEEPADLDKEFEELISGKYKEQFSTRVQNTVQRRFKNNADFENQLAQYKDAVAPIAEALGVDVSDIKGLKKAFESNDGLYAQLAEEQGLTPEQLRENLQLRADAKKGRAMQQEILKQQEQRAMFEQWDAQAEELKGVFPGFDLNQELKNTDFLENLELVRDVGRAFYLTHMEDILSGAMETSAKTAQQQTVKAIQQKAARPPENAASSQPAIIRKDDPSKMTAEERRIVAEKVRRGERIVF